MRPLRKSATKKQIAYYEKRIKLYEEAERLAKLQRFGQSSEKSKFQFNFFDEAELDEALGDLEKQIEKVEVAEQEKRKAAQKRKVFTRSATGTG